MTVSWLAELAGFALPMAVGAAATAIYYRWDDLWPRVDAWLAGPQARPVLRLVADERPYDQDAQIDGRASRSSRPEKGHLGGAGVTSSPPPGKVARPALDRRCTR